MNKIRNNKGITLVALVITILVLLILAGISISGGIAGADKANENRLITELGKVQQAITQRYTKYELTKDSSLLVGTKVDLTDLTDVPASVNWKVLQFTTGDTVSIHPERKYYRLSKSDLENLGLTGDYHGSSYVVNYFSGEVYDENQIQTASGNVLYKTAIANEASELGDEVIKDGLLVYYDAINNTGSGHSSSTTVWKDLSGNGNDAELNGFNGTATSGWHSNYLAFDGQNDWGKTVKEVDYNSSKELTIEFLDLNGTLSQNTSTRILFESSSNWNLNNDSYGIGINEGGQNLLRLTFHGKGVNTNYNIKQTQNSALNSSSNIYTVVFNSNNLYNDYIKIYKNSILLDILPNATYTANVSNEELYNYILYIGARKGQSYFTKMNLANLKIYNKALTETEIKHNYILDKNRYGIEE